MSIRIWVRCLQKWLLLAGFIFLVLSVVFCVSSKVEGDGWVLFNPVLGSEGLLAVGLFLLWVGLGLFLGEKMREMFERK